MSDNVFILCPTEQGSDDNTVNSLISEAQGLCLALNLNITDTMAVTLKKIDPSTYISKGHLETIKNKMQEQGDNLLYIDAHIKPGQQRDLEEYLDAKVIDRTGLILEIFADRAKTQEGRIQVDLAYKTYQKSRVVRAWSHLERQRGSTSFIGGPGEKQTELDRRMLDTDIKKLEADLAKVRSNRTLQRKARERESFPIIALVGYTNAGKSTLFNTLTKASVLSKDMLFATLDPTMRAMRLPNGQQAILSDTVGFIRNLPTELVAAFSATLEEVVEADIILHVHNLASDDMDSEHDTVHTTLENLGVDYESDNVIQVYNKLDLLNEIDPFEAGRIAQKSRRDAQSCAVSAVTKEGINDLLSTIVYHLSLGQRQFRFEIPAQDGKAIAWLHANSTVDDIEYNEDKAVIDITIGEAAFNKFTKVFEYEGVPKT